MVGSRGEEGSLLGCGVKRMATSMLTQNNYVHFSPKKKKKIRKKKEQKNTETVRRQGAVDSLPFSQSLVHAGGSLCRSEWPVIIIRTTGIFLLINFGISRQPCMFSTLLSSGGKVLAV